MYKLIAIAAFVLISSQSFAGSEMLDKFKKNFKNDKEFSFAINLLAEEVERKLDALPVGDPNSRKELEYLVGLETDLEIISPKSVKCSEKEFIIQKLTYYYTPKTSRVSDLPKHTKDFISLILHVCNRE